MCGLAGRIGLNQNSIDVAPLANMMDVVHHRGPNAQGYALFDIGGSPAVSGTNSRDLENRNWPNIRVAWGHRRLSIIDLSSAANQPMSYEDESYWLVFNGAIYNYIELREELLSAGLSFRTDSDTEVILAAYHHWGDQCVEHFNGMFAFAILDRPRRRVLCCRDRLGIKPFYYAIHDGVLSFGSEIKQLLEAGIPRKANPRRVFDYMIVGSTDHHEETCFAGVQQLMPGHRMTIELDQSQAPIRLEEYWSLQRDETIARLPIDEVSQRVRELLHDSVRLRMRCDVPLGSCLSGGLDSSTVVMLMSRIRAEQGKDFEQHTFTYRPSDAKIDESRYAQLVSQQIQAKRHIRTISPEEVFEKLDTFLWHEEEPIGDLTHFARSQVMALARERGVTVVLDGQGGDELFLGYPRYYVPTFLGYWQQQGFGKAVREFRLATKHSSLSPMRLAASSLLFGNVSLRTQFFRRRALRWINPSFLARHSVREVAEAHHLSRDLWEMQRRDMQIQLPHLLRHEDRDSMASSIEARTPLLDHRLVEFVMSLGAHAKIHDGWTKYCLRTAMEGILPPEIQWRRDKLGFAVPTSTWMQRVSSYAREWLQGDLASEQFIDCDKLRRGLASGKLKDKTLWRIVSLEKTMRIFGLE